MKTETKPLQETAMLSVSLMSLSVFIMTFQGQACLIYIENSQIMKTSRTQYMFI